MAKTGSPEWFNEKGRNLRSDRMPIDSEKLRAAFFRQFSPKILSEMNGEQLLRNVFGNADECMIRLLMYGGYNEAYRNFGATGTYPYLGVLYNKKESSAWTYKEGSKSVDISYSDAVTRAEFIRDKLIECVNSILQIGNFSTIHDYEKLERRLSNVFFAKYPWATKYFQMLFPYLFPGMYADSTLDRAISIIGLPDHGHSHRILNIGEIALFIRRCDINNIVFNTIYAEQWTWDGNPPPCESATDNYNFAISKTPVVNDNLSYYTLPTIEEIEIDVNKHASQIKQAPVTKAKLNHIAVPTVNKNEVKPVDPPRDDTVIPALFEGIKVRHSKFGEGTITAISEDETQITVSFLDCQKAFCSDKANEMNAFKKGFLTVVNGDNNVKE